jgi:hypothetical protein
LREALATMKSCVSACRIRPRRDITIVVALLTAACGGSTAPVNAGPDAGSPQATQGTIGDGSTTGSNGYFYANRTDGGHIYAASEGAAQQSVLEAGAGSTSVGPAVAADASRVYYGVATTGSTMGGASLVWVPLAGGTPTTLATGVEAIVALALDNTHVYLATWRSYPAGPGQIARVPKVGGTLESLVTLHVQPAGLAVQGGQVYWTQADGTIQSVSSAGGAIQTLATGQAQPGAIVATSEQIAWLNVGELGTDCSPTGGSVVTLPHGAATPTVIASGIVGAHSLAAGPSSLYWSVDGGFCNDGAGLGAILGFAGNSTSTIRSGLTMPGDLFVAPEGLYFSTVTDPNAWTTQAGFEAL